MKNLLWIGDAGCPSGFARATHEILATLHEHFNVTVLGLNYRGDPHDYPYSIYAAAAGGDTIGVGRLIWMCDLVKPDVIVVQNDGWHVPYYMQQLRKKLANGEYAFPEYAAVPVVAAVAVDGKNFDGQWLNGVSSAIFWTKFALAEAREGGYKGPACVIPLGVDLDMYAPQDKLGARLRRRLPSEFENAFVVGNINRNQPRKRWDLTVKFFAEWITKTGIRDVWLYMHAAPTNDSSVDVVQLARYYGVVDRLALVTPEVFYGSPEEDMADTYNCFDVCISTTQGEGFGLTALEAMACGVPCILPDWSALGDWAKDAAWLVPCKTTAVGSPYVNVIGGVPDQAEFTKALQALYLSKTARENNAQAALERAREPQFRWENIGLAYLDVLSDLLHLPSRVATLRRDLEEVAK